MGWKKKWKSYTKNVNCLRQNLGKNTWFILIIFFVKQDGLENVGRKKKKPRKNLWSDNYLRQKQEVQFICTVFFLVTQKLDNCQRQKINGTEMNWITKEWITYVQIDFRKSISLMISLIHLLFFWYHRNFFDELNFYQIIWTKIPQDNTAA